MKIKRFEATSMSEALRQIKKEFGDEAVILSAKTHKKSQRFLGKKSSRKVVVTAAADNKSNASQTDRHPSANSKGQFAKNTAYSKTQDLGTTGNNIFTKFNPITKTGQKIIKPKIVERITGDSEQKMEDTYLRLLMEAGLNEELAGQWDEQIRTLVPEQGVHAQELHQALSQVIQAKNIVGSLHPSKPGRQKQVVMIGPAGVGKTCAVAKMAARLALQTPNSVAIMSLDNHRVAGATELEKFSKIIGVPFKTAFTLEALKDGISQFEAYSLIIIDTPGISPDNHIQREELRRLLSFLDDSESFLLLNAAMQENAMEQIIQYFRPFNIDSLFFTGLDWASNFGSMINLSQRHKLPIGYLSDSPKIPDGLQVCSADHLAMLLIPHDKSENSDDHRPITLLQKRKPENFPYYVANRNSDIFHLHDCNAVKRINTENMIVFKDPAEAMGQQFKPCRMCSSELIVPKPIDRLARGFAGNRC